MYIYRCKTVLDLKKKNILRQKSFKIARHFTSNRCIYIELDRPNGLDKYIHSAWIWTAILKRTDMLNKTDILERTDLV